MGNALVNEKNNARYGNGSIEKGILRSVVRESWKGKIADTKNGNRLISVLDDHASRMEHILDTFDYGALCMPNIISNSKHMTISELASYLAAVEAIATGYSYKFNSEFVNIFIAGLTLKSRDPYSITRHFNNYVSELEAKHNHYMAKAEKENKTVNELASKLKSSESSIFRFLRSREIRVLRKRIDKRLTRATRFSGRAERFSGIVSKMRGITGR